MPRIDRLSPAAVGNGLTAAGRQLKAWWSMGWPAAETPPGLYSRLSLFSFGLFCLNILFLHYHLDIGRNWDYFPLEQSWIERLTAVLLGGASLTLFLAAAFAGRGWRRWVYALAGLVLLIGVGEEVSYGQHIFGFAAPDFWLELNRTGDINIHNLASLIPQSRIWVYVIALSNLLSLVTIAAFFNRKYALFGIPLPSLLLVLFLQIAFSFGEPASLLGIALGKGELIPVLGLCLAFAGFSRDKKLLTVVAATLTLSAATYYLTGRFSSYMYMFRWTEEVQEYLFSLVVLLYALQLLRDSGGKRWDCYGLRVKAFLRRLWNRSAAGTFPPPGRGWEYHSWRWAWPAACLLAAGFSIGMVVLDRQITAGLSREYQSLITNPPTIQAHSWNFYHTPGQLTYIKEGPCPQDNPRFFLHIIPIREADLPAELRKLGFQNLDFQYNAAVERFLSADGRCMATIELPDYDIASIRTGEQVRQPSTGESRPLPGASDQIGNEGIWRKRWQVELDLDTDYYRAAYQVITAGQAGPPLESSIFDLYRYSNALYYYKESCAPADTAARFFLHLIPENPEDLPAARRALGFANQDFDFNRHGQEFDGNCLAVVELPDYSIAEIRTGQFTTAGPVWEVDLPAGK